MYIQEVIKVDIEVLKAEQTAKIKALSHPVLWIKERIINLLDVQFCELPVVQQKIFNKLVRSAEHPEGAEVDYSAHPCFRIKDGHLLKDDSIDSFIWPHAKFEKELGKKANKVYEICLNDANMYHVKDFIMVYNSLQTDLDKEVFLQEMASRCNPYTVIETPEQKRMAVLVTQEIVDALGGKLIESWNHDNPEMVAPVAVGDLLVVEEDDPKSIGMFYRVEASIAADTYRKG